MKRRSQPRGGALCRVVRISSHTRRRNAGRAPTDNARDELGAAAFVGRVTRFVDRVVKPQRHFHGVAVGEQRRDLVGTAEAVADMVEVVEVPVRTSQQVAQPAVDLGRGRGGRRCDATAPQRLETL